MGLPFIGRKYLWSAMAGQKTSLSYYSFWTTCLAVWQARHVLRMKINRVTGFTMIEMMMTLVILAVLIAVSAPGLSSYIKNNRMLSQVYSMRAVLNGARSEALAQRTAVTVCRSENGTSCSGDAWNKGYIAFIDADRDGKVDDLADPRIFSATVIDAESLDISYSNGDPTDAESNVVSFDSQGYARDFGGTFTLCDSRGETAARGVIVSPSGSVRALDPNDPVTCP